MQEKKFKRRIKLIKPRLQVKLITAFTCVAGLALLLQYLLVAQRLSWTAARLPAGGQYLMEELPGILLGVLAVSFAVLFPLTFAIGVIVTFRVAGPVYRFEQYLTEVTQGKDPGVLRLRDGDELQGLCHLINEVRKTNWAVTEGYEPLSSESAEPTEAQAESETEERAELRKVC